MKRWRKRRRPDLRPNGHPENEPKILRPSEFTNPDPSRSRFSHSRRNSLLTSAIEFLKILKILARLEGFEPQTLRSVVWRRSKTDSLLLAQTPPVVEGISSSSFWRNQPVLPRGPAQNLHSSCTQRRNLTLVRGRKALCFLGFFGATRRIRTDDLLITKHNFIETPADKNRQQPMNLVLFGVSI